MSWFKKESKEAWTRFKQWLLPAAIRTYTPRTRGARVYRYPSVGSEPRLDDNDEIDYKTAYRDSVHNVRYDIDLKNAEYLHAFLADPIGETVEEKLVRYQYLKKEDVKKANAVEAAKKKYQDELGEPAQVKIFRDDFKFTEGIEDKDKREFIQEFVGQMFNDLKELKYLEAWSFDLNDIYKPQIYYLKSLDLAGDDPVYRQLVMDIVWNIDEISDRRKALGEFPVFKGQKSTWNILDDSFSNEQIQQVQSSVRVFDADNYQETAPALVENQIPPEKPTPTIKVPLKTQFVED